MNNCSLCQLEIQTELYFETDVATIANCIDHNLPIAVLKEHKEKPNAYERQKIDQLINLLFPGKKFKGPEKQQEHWYWHQEVKR